MDYDKFVNIVIGSEQYSLFISCNDSSFSIMLNEQHDEKISNFKHQSHYSLEQLISLNSIFKQFSSIKTICESLYSFISDFNNIHLINLSKDNNTNIYYLQLNQFINQETVTFLIKPTNNYFQSVNYHNQQKLNQEQIVDNAGNVFLKNIIINILGAILLCSLIFILSIVSITFEKIDSVIILTKKQQLQLQHWLKPLSQIKFELLFRATRDGERAADFIRMCNGKSPTLTIIKTTEGNIFGGYTEVKWEKTFTDEFRYDPNAFIFSFYNNMKISPNNPNEAVKMGFNDGPKFGAGCDIYIPDKCITGRTGYTHTITYQTKTNYEINGGNYTFQVEDYEVFLIK